MTVPRILLVDDQYARDTTQWLLLRNRLALVEHGNGDSRTYGDQEPIAEVILCSGQRYNGDFVDNDYEAVRDAVWSAGVNTLCMVLLDVTFLSGKLRGGGPPEGRADDGIFGELVYQRLTADFPLLPVVLITSREQRDLSNTNVPYLAKVGLTPRELRRTLLQHGRLSPEQARSVLGLPDTAVAAAPATLAAFKEAYLHADSKRSVLILGDTGVGKEVMARYIHKTSARRDSGFVSVNVAAFAKEQLEAELFGIEAKTATDVGFRIGRFESAAGGTLFLDEIGDMPLDMQVKVLRALESGEIYRVGGRTAMELDVRIISATNRDLFHLMACGSFREDLLRRIDSVIIEIPPLSARPDGIEPLAILFLTHAARAEGKVGVTLSPQALRVLQSHTFPGNVRQLEHLINSLVGTAGHNALIGESAVIAAWEHSTRDALSRLPRVKANQAGTKGEDFLTPLAPKILAQRLANLSIDPKDTSVLAGAIPALESAYRKALRRLLGAALERTRDPLTSRFNKQRAIRLLTGDPNLRGKASDRWINDIIGRNQQTPVTEIDLDHFLEEWRAHHVAEE